MILTYSPFYTHTVKANIIFFKVAKHLQIQQYMQFGFQIQITATSELKWISRINSNFITL